MFIYEEFPLKNPCTIPKREDVIGKDLEDLEKTFKKAVINYHPDRQDEEKFGIKWKILCEEITKYLTIFYEASRGCGT